MENLDALLVPAAHSHGRHVRSVTPLPKLLQFSIPLKDLDSVVDPDVVYRLIVPPGATRLEITTSGGVGDCGIFARRAVLEVAMNPDRTLLESDYTNNVTTIPVTIPPL